jgi:CRISPR/Cas system-associated exonuclease Cas4 (RecB family)
VDAGVRMLTVFHDQVATNDNVRVVAVELPFDGLELADPDTGEPLQEKLTGVIDLVVSEGDHNVVVEHKTAARKWTRDQLDQDFQVTAYKLAARQKLGLGDVGLRYQVVTKTKVAAVQVEDVVRDELAEVDFLRVAAGMLRAIGAGAFWPVRSWACRSCQYAHVCSRRTSGAGA